MTRDRDIQFALGTTDESRPVYSSRGRESGIRPTGAAAASYNVPPVVVQQDQSEEPVSKIDIELLHVSRATVEQLQRQPHLRIRLPKANAGLPTQRAPQSAVPVIINGAVIRVPRGVTVDVPQSVYHILEQAGYLDGTEAALRVPPPRQIEFPVSVV